MAACCHPSAGPAEFEAAQPAPQPWVRFAIAIVLAGLSMQLSLGVNLSPVAGATRWWIHGGLALAALLMLLLLGGPIFRRSWSAARAGRVTLEQLFFLGILGAFGASVHSSVTGTGAIYYEVVGVLAAVYTFGQMLVERQRGQANRSLQRLAGSLRMAIKLTCCGQRREVPVSELEPGDRVLVARGQRLPVDGVIAEGRAYLQEIAHTGEPFPVAKSAGDPVLAGSVALDGDLIISVSGAGGNRELDRITERLAAAMSERSAWQQEAGRWMTWFVPCVVTIAATTFAFWLWRAGWPGALFNALAVLLVACPCGLGLGVPMALWHATHRLAHLGIVPAGSELIERLARVHTVVFDKTGTLTDEEIRLEALVTLDPADEPGLRARLALIERHCTHPVARPFHPFASAPTEKLLGIETLPGQGIVARLQQSGGRTRETCIGNRGLLQPEHGAQLAELRRRLPPDAPTGRELFVIEEGRLSAIALLAETVRPAVSALAPRLRALGLEVAIMTGDASPNEQQWVDAGLPVSSGMTASQKAAAVRALEAKNERVLFVGDGLNDAEAMAAATASLALHGGDGTARAQAHGELAGASLGALSEAIALSRAACRQIRLILAISLAYNGAGLLLAATGLLHPVAAASIMFASSMTVVWLAGHSGSSGLHHPPILRPTDM